MSIVQDASSSGPPRAVASAPCAEAPDRPGRAPGPVNRRLRIPFQYPQCQRARRSAGGSFKPTAYLKNAERERPAGPCGPAENAGYMWRHARVSNAFAEFFAVFCDSGADAAPAGAACRHSPRRYRPGRSGAPVSGFRREFPAAVAAGAAAESRHDGAGPPTPLPDSSLDNPAQLNQ